MPIPGACVGDDLRPDSGKKSEFPCVHQWFIAAGSRTSFPAKLYLQPDQLSLTEQKLKLLMRRLKTTFEKFILLGWFLGGQASAFLGVFPPWSSLSSKPRASKAAARSGATEEKSSAHFHFIRHDRMNAICAPSNYSAHKEILESHKACWALCF